MKSKIIILLLAISGLFACSNTEQEAFDPGDLSNKPDHSLANIDINMVDSTSRKANIKADSAFVFVKDKLTKMKHNIEVIIFSTSNKPMLTLTADSVIIDDKTKNMTAFGKILVKSDEQATTMQTSKLDWDNTNRIVYTKEYVKIVSPREVLQGYGFESDEKLSYYKIYKVIGEQK